MEVWVIHLASVGLLLRLVIADRRDAGSVNGACIRTDWLPFSDGLNAAAIQADWLPFAATRNAACARIEAVGRLQRTI
jgi:hypothetical protein